MPHSLWDLEHLTRDWIWALELKVQSQPLYLQGIPDYFLNDEFSSENLEYIEILAIEYFLKNDRSYLKPGLRWNSEKK